MLNPDYRDMLCMLNDEGVEYLVVGAHALAARGYRIAGEYDTTQSAASVLLAGFTLSVQAAFQAGEAEGE